MRLMMAGVLLLGVMAATAHADDPVEGTVQSMGFGTNGYYRPNCWTPIKIRLRSKVGEPRTYKLIVIQEDMDHDRVQYSRLVTVNGNTDERKVDEEVWAYFIPQPRDTQTQNLKIFLCTPEGKQLVQVPVSRSSGAFTSLDMPASSFTGGRRGAKLVLLVGNAGDRPLPDPYVGSRGTSEEVAFETASARDLPTDPQGYQCVDWIVLLNTLPTSFSTDTQSALEKWVKEGGKLVVATGGNWLEIKNSPLGPMLPVELDKAEDDEPDAASLRALGQIPIPAEVEKYFDSWKKPKVPATQPAQGINIASIPGLQRLLVSVDERRWIDPWPNTAGKKSTIIRATPREGAVVSYYSQTNKSSPYIARWMYGLGSVTWVAQNLAEPNLVEFNRGAVGMNSASFLWGWPRIWDTIFDVPHGAGDFTVTDGMAAFGDANVKAGDWAREYVRFAPSGEGSDPSSVFQGMMNVDRGVGLLALAVLFFIGYWAIAGPGSYFFLLARKRVQYSWVAFALCAGAATAVTSLIVKLVLRGSPQLHHVTFVTATRGQNAVARSHLGLFIPRDGDQRIGLPHTTSEPTAYLAPYPVHPFHLPEQDLEFLGYREYDVPMRMSGTTADAEVAVPYRSTLKRLDARWVGPIPGVIDGEASIGPGTGGGALSGKLVNSTGTDLYNVYLVYRDTPGVPWRWGDDMMLRILPGTGGVAWPKGQMIDLAGLLSRSKMPDSAHIEDNDQGKDDQGPFLAARAPLNLVWADHWRGSGDDSIGARGSLRDFGNPDRAFLVLSVYDRLWPIPNRSSSGANDRSEILRYAGRELDASHVISCGQLLVLASSMEHESPLPFALEVEGDRIGGQGTTYYQFIVPLHHNPESAKPPALENDETAAGAPETAQPAPPRGNRFPAPRPNPPPRIRIR